MKYENGDLLGGSHNILNMWKNYISQLLKRSRGPFSALPDFLSSSGSGTGVNGSRDPPR
jgi:hypothetical protein